MFHRVTRFMLALAFAGSLVFAAGCDKHDDHKEKGGSAHAAATAKPGSHEDWCGEHNVPESQCTRCNKKLEAAFKATGDWCNEHGLPKSQDTKCDPNLKIVRPPKGN
jgi:hypothetical protein